MIKSVDNGIFIFICLMILMVIIIWFILYDLVVILYFFKKFMNLDMLKFLFFIK